ncbi:MAG: cytochrome c [Rhodospirillaceae bacterium]|nr:cytochrome c [Rhodospirillaceae bacterium]
MPRSTRTEYGVGLNAVSEHRKDRFPTRRGFVTAAALIGGAAVLLGGYRLAMDWLDAHGAREGARHYAAHCAACHGPTLGGQNGWQSAGWQNQDGGDWPAPPLDAAGHAWMHDDGALFLHTKNGSARSPMPAFADTLSDNEIWQIFAYVKSRWPESLREFQRAGDPYADLPADLPSDWTYPPACEPGAAPGGAL